MKKRFGSLLVVLSFGGLMATTAQAGLLATDGAGTVEVKHVELELNGSYASDKAGSGGVTMKRNSTDGDITLTTGMTNNLDISVTLPYTFNARENENDVLTRKAEGFNDSTLQLKYQFLDYEGVKLSVKPGLIIPTGKEKEGLSDVRVGFTALLIATKEFAEGEYAIHVNTGYERHNIKDAVVDASTRSDIFGLSIAGEAEVTKGLKLQAECGISSNSDKASNTPIAFVIAGGTYEVSKTLEVYAGVKFGLTAPADDVTALLGIKAKF